MDKVIPDRLAHHLLSTLEFRHQAENRGPQVQKSSLVRNDGVTRRLYKHRTFNGTASVHGGSIV